MIKVKLHFSYKKMNTEKGVDCYSREMRNDNSYEKTEYSLIFHIMFFFNVFLA